ncbi:IS66 family insertion sequence element accessory protein TnpA [Acetivibrio clariflavus]|uniref:IS66 family insertion sequence element accessory protein TnpA n=1 Tax=Acetivibrio clariflavus TaxID=288965 RepID=UPI00211E82A9|nr:transposase [Acetivibrio clariflavus]
MGTINTKPLESGQSIKEFCRTNGVSKATYYYWQKKVSEAKCTVVEEVKEPKIEVQVDGCSLHRNRCTLQKLHWKLKLMAVMSL